MTQAPHYREAEDLRVRIPAAFVCFLVVGVILGIWHAQMGARAVFTFRNDEPYSSWIGALFGPLSTLPAVGLAMFARRWSAAWLVTGGLVSLSALLVREAGKGHPVGELVEFLAIFLVMVAGPMIALGLGLVWIHRRSEHRNTPKIPAGRSRRRELLPLMLSSYFLLSLGAFFVADLPLFNAVFETRWGFWVIPLLLGPFVMLAMGRFLGVPVYLAETVVVLALFWLATTAEGRRRAALVGALAAAWVVSGLLFLAVVVGWS